MKFNKDAFKAEAKEILKSQGKEHLADFIEDVAGVSWDLVKLAAKHTEDFAIDDMVVNACDNMVKAAIDKISEN